MNRAREQRAVATLCFGPLGVAMAELSRPLLQNYAERCQADFQIWADAMGPAAELAPRQQVGASFSAGMLEKMTWLERTLAEYERVLWIDLDVLVRPDAPDLFALIPEGQVAMFDECTIANDCQVWHRHQHMVEVCEQEGLPVPDSGGRYFNCGLMMLPASCRWLFAPRRKPIPHPWCEQSVVNVRLFLRPDVRVLPLPECFNRFVYWPGVVPRRYEAMSYFLHYAGPPDDPSRLKDMRKQLDRWREDYKCFPWDVYDR